MTNTQALPFLTLPAVIRESARKYGSHVAFSQINEGQDVTYSEAMGIIDALGAYMEAYGIVPGDKVALLGGNSTQWSLVYFAITSMGATVVPILPDFTPQEIENALAHSGARAIFVSRELVRKMENIQLPHLSWHFLLEDFSCIAGKEVVPFGEDKQPVNNHAVQEEDLAAIIYTSGTTGYSKGVMLSHRNIVFNAVQSGLVHPVNTNDRFLSILPLSHTYENTIGLILPVMNGSRIYYLGGPPTPNVLVPALKKVKPTVMLTVPLIIEKIYKAKIQPLITKNAVMRHLYAFPPVRKGINRLFGMKLKKTFGGKLEFFGIGGAKLNGCVEKFLLEARFPYAVGYGLTETSPLAAGFGPSDARWQSTGPPIRDGQIHIHNPDPKTGEGEIWIKGDHVMQGYYKNPEKTAEVITPEGWFKTGDLGKVDKDGYLYIRGRLKNMIVGSSGENIYPEEIEAIINNFNHVVESVVIEKKGKLVALVHFNQNELEEKYKHLKSEIRGYLENKRNELRRELLDYVNSRVNRFSRLQMVLPHKDPFEKTATKKIKRFLYTSAKRL